MNGKGMCSCPTPGAPSCCLPMATLTPQPPCNPCVPGVPPATCPPNCCPDTGCPRGFKPCVMSMTPPSNCDPRGIWLATIEKCPPKRR